MVSAGSQVKGALAMCLGLFLSTDRCGHYAGLPAVYLWKCGASQRVAFIPAMIGVFGVSEVMRSVMEGELLTRSPVSGRKIFGERGTIQEIQMNFWRSGILGTFIGILPGAGADIAAWVAYAASKRGSKEPEKYGNGSIEAIIDAGTANNSCLAGDWVPALVFGIPGDSITAIVIGVLFMKGLRPGADDLRAAA